MKDNEIVDLYWKRSERAIIESKSKYGACCRGIAYRILQSTEDANECENDTYLRAWNAMPPSRPRMLGSFLSRIARNLSIDMYKRKRTAKRGGGDVPLILHELEECMPYTGLSVEGSTDGCDLSEILDSFLESISKEARVFFVQRYWMSCPIVEIASKNNVSEGKVKMSLYRTRRALKKCLDERVDEYEIAS